MNLKNVLFLMCILFFSGVTLTSCSEDLNNLSEEENFQVTSEYGTNGSELSLEAECLEFVFPLEVVLSDGTVILVNDVETLEQLWEDNEDEIDFVYPFSVVLEDGSTVVVNNEEDWEELEDICEENEDYEEDEEEECIHEYEDCFELVYPVTIILPDSSERVIESEEDFDALEDLWEEDYEEEFEYDLVFPVSLELEDGTIITINNEEELDELLESCESYEEDEEEDDEEEDDEEDDEDDDDEDDDDDDGN